MRDSESSGTRDRAVELTEQQETPVLDGLRLYGERAYLPFHTPGHKLGVGAPEGLRETLAKGMEVDLCLMPGFEDSRKRGGYLLAGERLAAAAWSVDRAFFLTNGSSGGLHTLALALAPEGTTVIVPRNAHRALLAGLILSGAQPVFLQPEIDPEWGIPLNVSPAVFAAALAEHREAATVFVSSPSYNGLCADVRKIATTAHAQGATVAVDEAWGAHLPFCTLLPKDALSQGADVIVTSVHKLLSGTSQASLIAAQGERVDLGRVAALVDMLRSTSMLVPILASIDCARMQMATEGEQLWARAVELADGGRAQLRRVPGLRCLGEEIVERSSVADYDPTRLTVSAADLGWAGYELEWELRESYGIAVESADALNIVMNVTHADTAESVARLVFALKDIAARGQSFTASSSRDATAGSDSCLSRPLSATVATHGPYPTSRVLCLRSLSSATAVRRRPECRDGHPVPPRRGSPLPRRGDHCRGRRLPGRGDGREVSPSTTCMIRQLRPFEWSMIRRTTFHCSRRSGCDDRP